MLDVRLGSMMGCRHAGQVSTVSMSGSSLCMPSALPAQAAQHMQTMASYKQGTHAASWKCGPVEQHPLGCSSDAAQPAPCSCMQPWPWHPGLRGSASSPQEGREGSRIARCGSSNRQVLSLSSRYAPCCTVPTSRSRPHPPAACRRCGPLPSPFHPAGAPPLPGWHLRHGPPCRLQGKDDRQEGIRGATHREQSGWSLQHARLSLPQQGRKQAGPIHPQCGRQSGVAAHRLRLPHAPGSAPPSSTRSADP